MTSPGRTAAVFTGVALAVALALAFFVAPHASESPDGLEKVAIDEGFAGRESPHAMAGGPAAGYQVDGVDDPLMSTGVAGVLGVLVTFAIGAGVVLVLQRSRRARAEPAPPGSAAPAAPPA
jgi:hypothetical protein